MPAIATSFPQHIDGHVPSVSTYNQIGFNGIVGHVPSDTFACVIEEVIEMPAGFQLLSPMALIGKSVKRCWFSADVSILSYKHTALGDDYRVSWKSRSESVKTIVIPQPDDVRDHVPDIADGLPTSQCNEPDFPVSRRAVTHLAHAVARLRAGLMRFHVLACGDHPMMDGSHSVLKAQGIADEVTSRIIPQIDDNYFPFVVDYTTDRIFVFSIHNLLK